MMMNETEIRRLHHTQHAPLLQIVDFHIDFDGNEFDLCEKPTTAKHTHKRQAKNHGSSWKVFLG